MRVQRRLPGSALVFLLSTLLAGCSLSGAPATQTSPTDTATTAASATTAPATPTSAPQGDWQTYTDATYGFHLDVPSILSLGSLPDKNAASFSLLWRYSSPNQAPPNQALFAETSVNVYVTDTLTDGSANPCTKGTRITIGSGVTAYEDDSLDFPTPAPGGGAAGAGGLDVNVATGGVYLHITLYGNYPRETFRQRYGAIWQHILNSFVPGPAVPNGNPCG